MPYEQCTTSTGKRGWRWGKQHCYPHKAGAERQAAAIFANGYQPGKSYAEELRETEEAEPVGPNGLPPLSVLCQDYLDHVIVDCEWNDSATRPGLVELTNHFIGCRGESFDRAQLLAHSLLGRLKRAHLDD